MKSEGGEDKEREKGWVLGDARGLGDRGGSEQAHGLLWVPKERMGPERGAERGGGGGSPSPLFSSPLSLSFVPSNHEATPQKRGVASPSMVYLGDTKAFLGEAKLYGGGGRASGGGAGGGEKQIQMAPQQYAAGVGGASGGGGAQEPKAGGTKEESQSLLRVRRTPPPTLLWDGALLRRSFVCYWFVCVATSVRTLRQQAGAAGTAPSVYRPTFIILPDSDVTAPPHPVAIRYEILPSFSLDCHCVKKVCMCLSLSP